MELGFTVWVQEQNVFQLYCEKFEPTVDFGYSSFVSGTTWFWAA